jgi:hypothetical protein
MRIAFPIVLTLSLLGCAGTDEVADTSDEDLVSSPQAAGIAPGSFEETAVLNLANDLALDAAAYRTRVKVTLTVANAILKYRTTAPGNRLFDSIAQVDALTGTGKAAFTALKTYGIQNGYDFSAPTKSVLNIPDNLGRPPTSNDVTVLKGFDGLSPAEVELVVRSKLLTSVHPSNQRFLADTILQSHKAFTIAIGNFLIANAPPERFLRQQAPGTKATLLGTASSLNPTILELELNGTKRYFMRSQTGGSYEPIDPRLLTATGIRYPVLMRCGIRLIPQGVRVEYPTWKADVLSSPTATIIEG